VILESSAASQLNTFDFLGREDSIEDKTKEIVSQGSDDSLGVTQTKETWPSCLLLQLFNGESGGMN